MRSWTERVPLRTTSDRPAHVRLREPRGGDELAVDGVDTRAAVGLLERLADGGAEVAGLSASDRDGLLASLHRGIWGDRIVATLECGACGANYDLAFDLADLQHRLDADREPARVVAPRALEDAEGVRFCLPSAGEEEEAALLGMERGRARLAAAIAGEAGAGDPGLDSRLEALAPLLDVDLDAPCAECGHPALARFDIQSFVLQRLLDEREGVLAEVDALAGGYGWSLDEILGLPRSLRQFLAGRIADRRPAWDGGR